jgi:hypothetical protein
METLVRNFTKITKNHIVTMKQYQNLPACRNQRLLLSVTMQNAARGNDFYRRIYHKFQP